MQSRQYSNLIIQSFVTRHCHYQCLFIPAKGEQSSHYWRVPDTPIIEFSSFISILSSRVPYAQLLGWDPMGLYPRGSPSLYLTQGLISSSMTETQQAAPGKHGIHGSRKKNKGRDTSVPLSLAVYQPNQSLERSDFSTVHYARVKLGMRVFLVAAEVS